MAEPGPTDSDTMQITIPTALTLFRIALLPVMVIVFYAPFRGANIAAAASSSSRRSPTGWMAGSRGAGT